MSTRDYLMRLRHIKELDEPEEIVRLLNRMNKNQTIPALVFDRHGQLRSFDVLHNIALSMLRYHRSPYEFTNALLNQQQHRKNVRTSHAIQTIRTEEPAFDTIEEQRAYYLKHPVAKDLPQLFYARDGLPLKSLNY